MRLCASKVAALSSQKLYKGLYLLGYLQYPVILMRAGLILFLIFIFQGSGLALSFNSNDNITRKISPAYSSYLKGLLSDRYGDSKRALKEYIKARKIDEESMSLKLRLAVQHIKLNNNNRAIRLLDELKDDKSVSLDAYLLLILLYSSNGQDEKANQEYEGMLSNLYKEKPDNLKIAESLAWFKMQKEDFDAALKIYENVVKLDPEYTDAYFWIGYLYEEKGNRPEAIKFWKKVLEFNPEHADALNSLGYIYAEEGVNLTEAELLVKKALEISPDSAAYLDSLGWVYFKMQKFNVAREYIEKAANLLKDPVILDHLGEIYYKLGELLKAKEVWNEALNINPKDASVQEKIKNIKDEISAAKD